MAEQKTFDALVDEAIVLAKKVENYRVTFGKKMKEVRAAAEAEGKDWEAVLNETIRPKIAAIVKPRQLQYLMATARAEDPEVAEEARRAANREAVARHRARTSQSEPDSALHGDVMRPPEATPAPEPAVAPAPQPASARAPAPPPPEPPQVRKITQPMRPEEVRYICAKDALEALDNDALYRLIAEVARERLGLVLTEPVSSERDDGATDQPSDGGSHVTAPDPSGSAVPADEAVAGLETDGEAERVSASTPAHESVPPAGLADEDFFAIPPICDRRHELVKAEVNDLLEEGWS